MRLPLSWIRLYLPLSETPEQIGDKLTTLGLEVDKIIDEGDDIVFEISLTPNLGHALSLLGLLRELKAIVDAPFTPPQVISLPPKGDLPFAFDLTVDHKVPLYAARRVKGKKVLKSPDWLKKTLENCGLQSIDPIVDVMNFVMMERGQPLHAFDAKALRGSIEVRYAKEGESFVGLDNKAYKLLPHHLVISDSEKVLALAGVLGAEIGSVNADTTEIVIEAAHFDPSVVRKQSKELGISTEASRRFERGIDHAGVVLALDRAVQLLQEIGMADALSETVKIEHLEFKPKTVSCRLQRIEKMLGLHLGVAEVSDIWKRLDMPFTWNGRDTFQVTIPSYRNDVKEEIDLIEEVARVFGLDNLPKKEAKFSLSSVPHAPIFLLEREARSKLLSLGLQEWMCCDLIDPKTLPTILDTEELPGGLLTVLNPSSEEQSVLRPSLLPGLLFSAKHNDAMGNHTLSAFEVGKIHFLVGEQPKEELMAAILMTGSGDFFDLKGIAESFFEGMNAHGIDYRPHHHSLFHPGRQAGIFAGDRLLGVMGEVHPKILRALDYPRRIYLLEISLHELHPLQKPREKMDPLPSFPSSTRDLTLTLDRSISYASIQAEIEKRRPVHLESFGLKKDGIFMSEKLGQNKQNVTLHFVYRGKEGTLPQETVDQEHLLLTDELTKSFVGV